MIWGYHYFWKHPVGSKSPTFQALVATRKGDRRWFCEHYKNRRHGTTRIDGLNPLWVSTPRSWRWAFGDLDCWTCGIFSCEWWHQKFHGCLPLPSLNSTNCVETLNRPFAAIKCDPFGCGVEGLHSDVTLPVMFNQFHMEHVLLHSYRMNRL